MLLLEDGFDVAVEKSPRPSELRISIRLSRKIGMRDSFLCPCLLSHGGRELRFFICFTFVFVASLLESYVLLVIESRFLRLFLRMLPLVDMCCSLLLMRGSFGPPPLFLSSFVWSTFCVIL